MTIGDDVLKRVTRIGSAGPPRLRERVAETLLSGRATQVYDKGALLFEVGARDRTLYFVRHGIVKISTITEGGREIIYELRTEGEIVGELCVLDAPRRNRAVIVERTEAVPIRLDHVTEALAQHPALLQDFLAIFSAAIAAAHRQVHSLAVDDVTTRLVAVLRMLAGRFGHPRGNLVEVVTYFTQEEISQMVMARRERVSTALNALRRWGAVDYSSRGHLMLDLGVLGACRSERTERALLPR